MWIKDKTGDCIRGSAISAVYVTYSDGQHKLNITLIGDPEAYLIGTFHSKEDAKAARDALIRKIGGEVIAV